jgi:hypothetical protein
MNKLLLSSVVALLLISPLFCVSQEPVTSPVAGPPGSASVAATPEASPKVTKVAAREQSARFAKLIAAAKSGQLVERFPEKHEAEMSIVAERLPAGISSADVFGGSYRASAKTSYVDGPAQSFDNTGALIASLPTDAKMDSWDNFMVTRGVFG